MARQKINTQVRFNPADGSYTSRDLYREDDGTVHWVSRSASESEKADYGDCLRVVNGMEPLKEQAETDFNDFYWRRKLEKLGTTEDEP